MAWFAQAVKARLPRLLSRANALSQRFGLNLTPNHFYSDFPDFRQLRNTRYWRKPYSMFGINGAEIGPQLDFARACCEPYQQQLAPADIYDRDDEPGYNPDIVCVEPYTNAALRHLAEQNKIVLHAEMAQMIDRSILTDVGEDGLTFIDSSHSLRVGGEVIQLICEVLPRLKPGVRVHLHDIPLPYDYGPPLLDGAVFIYREHALLYAFMVNNPRVRIEVSLSMLHDADPDAMRRFLPGYQPCKTRDGLLLEDGHFPTSIYLRITD